MNTSQLHFLGWHKPAVELIAERLLQLNTTEPQAFCRATVVVPTAESGRRLREHIAELAGKPILMPRICQASRLVNIEKGYSELTEYAAWIQVLSTHTPEEEWPTLFPTPPLVKLNWCYGMARQLMQLSNRLDDACLSPQQISKDFWRVSDEKEATRWEEIADIFAKTRRQLSIWGYPPTAAKEQEQRQLDTLRPMQGQLLIAACLPQMSERFRRFLDMAAQHCRAIHIYVNAPEQLPHKSLRSLFHPQYGTPLTDWQHEPICIPDSAIRITPNGVGMAQAALQACAHHSSDQIVLGCCDASFAPRLRQAFTRAGWPLNMPEGRSFLTTEIGQLPAQLLRAVNGLTKVHAIEPVLRNAALQRALGLSADEQRSFCQWLDKTLQTKLPAETSYLLKLAQAEEDTAPLIIHYLKRVGHLLLQMSNTDTLCPAFIRLGLQMQSAYVAPQELTPTAAFSDLLQAVADIQPKLSILQKPAAVLSLLQHLTAQASAQELSLVSTPRDKTALDATGWMELPYCHGSKLILCGVHDQCIPESPSVDAFLPESLCRHYTELPNIEQRKARDSFMLSALLHAFPDNAHIIIAQTADDGTPIAPSPLLLRFSPQETDKLLQRVNTLFTPLPKQETQHQPTAWEMHTSLDRVAEMEHISQLAPDLKNPWANEQEPFSPSTLATFLNCPLRFWLSKLMGLNPQESYENTKTAMNDAEYGTMMHRILELLVRQYSQEARPPLETSEDVYLQAKFIVLREFAKQYGKNLALPLQAQQHMLLQSLRSFCRLLCADYFFGWEPVYLEHKTQNDNWALDGSIPFRMTVDRVDRKRKMRSSEYTWRIVDYKTSDTSPEAKHREELKEETAALFTRIMPDFPLLLKPKKAKKGEAESLAAYRWKEVQLPLYAKWLMDTHQVKLEDIEVGYYILPRNKKECKYVHWKLEQEDIDNALTWVRAAVKLIRAGRCLLSAESLGWKTYADFGALSPDGDPRRMMGLPDLSIPQH